MNRNSKRLAETLVGLKEINLPSIIYSFLIKFNPNNPKLCEMLVTNALALAKRLKDPVHIAARANDLKDLSKNNPEKYLKFLYETKRALASVVCNYENAKQKYRTVSRKIKPQDAYQEALCRIKLLIAQCIWKNQPQTALEELKTASALIPNEHCLQAKIRKLICTLESKLLENNGGKNSRC